MLSHAWEEMDFQRSNPEIPFKVCQNNAVTEFLEEEHVQTLEVETV